MKRVVSRGWKTSDIVPEVSTGADKPEKADETIRRC
jgi:hypothetical protein